ncbi:MAG TPA: NlpC/P60 family protein [Pseudonocardiaceae bacterium]|nr:NlpC/P60 family protein [Pseudonocardiaceae bacterium]
MRLAGAVVVAAVGLQLAVVPSAGAVPPPPPHPSNSAVRQAQARAAAKAGQVGRITSRLSSAQAALRNLQDDVELKQENANKALVDLQTAQSAAARAQADANAAQISAKASEAAIDQLRKKVDEFAAGSFAQGSALGSVAAYFGSKSPRDLLERQVLLNEISTSELDVLNQMREARVQKANADSLARAALLVAKQKQAAAQAAKQAADAAIARAQAAAEAEAAQAHQLQANQASLQAQLTAAQATVSGLKSQQQQYQKWLSAKQAEEAAAAARAARASGSHGSRHHTISVASSGSVAVVLRRALSAVGIIYAWGGGNASGPTRGIHDGGVADEFGDFDKIGFDCSGLMVYAFAGAGVYLPHYSGYQYQAGRHVPISQIRPGDMLFYSSNGSSSGIHHVTLYIGNGEMVEAYESGMPVRVTSVRYYNGLMPYATRVL